MRLLLISKMPTKNGLELKVDIDKISSPVEIGKKTGENFVFEKIL